ncbi:hypothetical protein BCCH1_17630 [Burkholderia contaminans]|uniref:Uncharacterized protein n=1 Tax=Burkholderia contaminans TaxID=488447 RepID=A0A250L432_9BURK|nr:hypothetical protein BCCH1_17630 [Burkholderia contaminans]GLZ67093.1 hypothetical protein Bcon01_01380 [Burkholderia contaminans]
MCNLHCTKNGATGHGTAAMKAGRYAHGATGPGGKYRLRPHRQFDAMNCPVSRVRHLNAMQP